MFTAALLRAAKKRTQPTCPPTEEWTDKMCYVHRVGREKE